jgi:GNAT superfamily N-acetyltransferase
MASGTHVGHLVMRLRIRQAQTSEVGLVAQVLTSAAEKLNATGQHLWDAAETSEAAVLAHVRAGKYHIALESDGPVGVFRFQLEDGYFWPEIPAGTSAFIHKLAIRPEKQGHNLARVLLQHACELTAQHSRRFLRLDCVSGRPKLRAGYEDFGFRHHSELKLGNAVFDRFELEVG